ncbi:MAG: hypothetical protein EOP06_22675, partial [Proteobacteria bacterium]
MRTKLTVSAWNSALVFVFLIVSFSGFSQKKSEQTKVKDRASGSGMYQIESKIKGLSVIKDGILSGAPGTSLTGRIGMNEIEVSAPNYAQRRIRFWIKANETKTVVINLVEHTEPTTLDWKSSFKRFDPSTLANKASLCLGYQTKYGDGQFCDRTSLLQDIVFADDSLFRQDDLRDYQGSGDLAQFRRLVTRVAQSDATPEIEDFLSNHPAQLSAYHLASLHS